MPDYTAIFNELRGSAAPTAAQRTGTADKQVSVLTQMESQLAADSAKHGATSAQAHADLVALQTTSNKWGAQSSTDLAVTKASIQSSFLQLLGLNAKEDKLNTTGSGNLDQSKYIKAVLDQQLAHAKSVLATDKTVGASKQAIDLARQKVADTESATKQVQSHIDQLKSVADQITKAKDTLSQQQALETALGKVQSATKDISTVLGTGITITKAPNTKATGSIKLSIS